MVEVKVAQAPSTSSKVASTPTSDLSNPPASTAAWSEMNCPRSPTASATCPTIFPRSFLHLMAILLSPVSGTASAVRNQFLEPLRTVHDHAITLRHCPVESDWDWLTKGVDRVLANVRSGRDFLQTFQRFWTRELQVGPCFETLASERRLGMVAECSGLLRRRVDALRPSPLAQFESLASFDLYAGDGHYLEHATHDPMQRETPLADGPFLCAESEESESLSVDAGGSGRAQEGA